MPLPPPTSSPVPTRPRWLFISAICVPVGSAASSPAWRSSCRPFVMLLALSWAYRAYGTIPGSRGGVRWPEAGRRGDYRHRRLPAGRHRHHRLAPAPDRPGEHGVDTGFPRRRIGRPTRRRPARHLALRPPRWSLALVPALTRRGRRAAPAASASDLLDRQPQRPAGPDLGLPEGWSTALRRRLRPDPLDRGRRRRAVRVADPPAIPRRGSTSVRRLPAPS